MALRINRYTVSGTAAADDYVGIAEVPVALAGSIDASVPPVGVEININIVDEVTSSARTLSAKLLFIVGFYEDTGAVIFNTNPNPVTNGEWTILLTGGDSADYAHLEYPDVAAYYDFFKTIVSFDIPSGSNSTMFLGFNTPNVACQYTAEALVYYKI